MAKKYWFLLSNVNWIAQNTVNSFSKHTLADRKLYVFNGREKIVDSS